MEIVECISCDGYGWFEDENGESQDCSWCGGVGYTYRDEAGIDHRIPSADYERISPELERLEAERLRRMGYTGSVKRRW
ncbi:MAG: hypothetical protein H6672_07885 [Anaerolineaceae bacterium]|nr:hypothetical protein [Anaerolineaceae bacterium]